MSRDRPTYTGKPELKVGSYRLLQSLGTGGMSSVFRAEHVETGLEVAVKVLPRNLAKNPTLLQRFLREAKSAEALEHPNIVAIYDRGVDQGRHYLVLEYVAGGDLHDRVRENGPMPVAEAVAVVRAVAEGLNYAASQGLIHRDIKPANLLLAPDGRVKITDLGLALHAEHDDERVTREGTTVGTVDYMAPEQARDSRATSVRSDIYSLGCTFYFLLTGQPPFPGGDVAEKLNRHIAAAPPDPRDFRPEIPRELARLLRIMMAKRPEARFEGYEELIAALDELPSLESASAESSEPLDALVDDDEAPASSPEPLDALVDDDEELEGSGTLGEPLTLGGPKSGDGASPQIGEFALTDLAKLDDERAPALARKPAGVVQPIVGEPEPIIEDEQRDGPPHAVEAAPSATSAGERSWILTCVLAGLALVVLVIGIDILVRTLSSQPAADPVAEGNGESVVTPSPKVAETARKPEPAAPKPEPAAPKVVEKAPKEKDVEPVSHVVVARSPWVEPLDTIAPSSPEPSFDPGVEGRFLPDWAVAEVPRRLSGKRASVRRLPDPRDPEQKSSLAAALGFDDAGTIEIADEGPFFEDSLRQGAARLIRARPGYRPILALGRSGTPLVKEGRACLDVAEKTLILDGIDLVVDVSRLPPKHESLILCEGGVLTLRNCTVTIVGQSVRRFSLVRCGPGERPSRIRLEQTLVRGNLASVVEIAGGAADIVFSRSLLWNGQGTAVTSGAAAERRVFVVRSVVATMGPAIELVDASSTARSKPLAIHALGSTFARFQSPRATSLISAKGDSRSAAELISWLGDFNTYTGWSDHLSVGSAHAVRVAGLAAARVVWAGSDPHSTTSDVPWPAAAAADQVVPEDIRTLDPSRFAFLTRVGSPGATVREKALGTFPEPLIPAPRSLEGSPPPGVRELTFDARTEAWRGDLGFFLVQNIQPGDTRVRVRAAGTGNHVCSPARLPEGVSLELVVEPGPDGVGPSWTAVNGAESDALIEVRGGDLVLSGVRLARDGSARLKHLVRVERGHLVLTRCRLTAPGVVENGGGGLIAFSSPGTQPLQTGDGGKGPFEKPTDRPTCRVVESILTSGGDVIVSHLGRGSLALSQSVVIAGRTAFRLRPGMVARQRFDAALWLDHCTVASERDIVSIGPWRGAEPGPDRPWLVTTRSCVFFGTYDRRSPRDRESVLLRADAEAIAHGALFWHSTGDALGVPCFTALGDSPPQTNPRDDPRVQWTTLWGQASFQSSGDRSTQSDLRPVVFPLRPGLVEPGDLEIDPDSPSGGRNRELGADLARLGVKPTPKRGRR